MKNFLFILILLQNAEILRGQMMTPKTTYIGTTERDVGAIPFDAQRDNPDFKVCNSLWVQEYYGVKTAYRNENKVVVQHFLKNYKPIANTTGDGFINIRFLVNCEGETDRYRVSQVDLNYRNTEFNTLLIEQLLTLTKQLKDWMPGQYKGVFYDSYKQIGFKIRNGQLKEVLP